MNLSFIQKKIGDDNNKGDGHFFSKKVSVTFLIVTFLILALIVIIGSLIYSNTLNNPFVFDDLPFIVHNKDIKDLGDLKAIWSIGSSSRFISFLSFAINYHFHKLNVFGYHLVNIVIHLLNGMLVFWLMLLTMRTPGLQDHPLRREQPWLLPTAVTFIFLTHPIQTQAVTYITQRFASLATFFYLAALCCFVSARLNRKKTFYVLSAIFAVMGMFTKEIVLTLPVMMVLYDAYFLRKGKKGFPFSWLIILAFVLIIPAIYSFRFLELLSIEQSSGSYLGERINQWSYLLTQFRVIVTYIRLLLLPVGQNLLYEFPASRSLLDPATLLSDLFLVAFLGAAVWLRKKRPLVSFGLLWFFIALSVESSLIVIRHVIFEHRVYLPSVGFFLSFIVGIYTVLKDRRAFIMLMAIMVGVYSYLSYERNRVWQSRITLWQDVTEKSPRLIKAFLNLGVAYTAEERYMDALKVYTELIERQPNAETFSNRGNVYSKLGEYDLAIEDYTKSLAIDERSARTLTNRGDAYSEKGLYKKALADYTQAIEVNPWYYFTFTHRGDLFLKQKKFVLAEKDFNEAIRLNPYASEPYMGIGIIAFTQKDYEKALDFFTHTLTLEPDNISALINRANTYSELGRYEAAMGDYEQALHLEPRNGQIYYNRAILLRKQGKTKKAEADFQKAEVLGYEP